MARRDDDDGRGGRRVASRDVAGAPVLRKGEGGAVRDGGPRRRAVTARIWEKELLLGPLVVALGLRAKRERKEKEWNELVRMNLHRLNRLYFHLFFLWDETFILMIDQCIRWKTGQELASKKPHDLLKALI